MNRLLIIGHTLPEAKTTAAGVRMMQLIDMFSNAGVDIVFASVADQSEYSETFVGYQVRFESIRLNDASFDTFLRKEIPDMVLYDRFMTEEQFGWRVSEICPDALTLLDTEDLHFLRKARQEAVENGKPVHEANPYSELAKREIASILRCDLTLIISEVEWKLLIEKFHLPEALLYYLPLFAEAPSDQGKLLLPQYDARQHFVTIGNFKHAPNADAVRHLKIRLWPAIKRVLPEAQLYIYGAYATSEIERLHSEEEGFLLQGWAPEAHEVLRQVRVCLAPLRFGAGLKGKVLTAWSVGTPVISTSIGLEGLDNHTYPRFAADTPTEWASEAVRLYQDKSYWHQQQQLGFSLLTQRFEPSLFKVPFLEHVTTLLLTLKEHRNAHFITQVMRHHTLQTYKYLSKYIAEKNRSKQ
ncbi:glycosyltransferase [Altibacter sp. HG106]|uniref:glycosyltransferase n=1 Tax=Altibacter sp. HG106 TaxID=3023937 RepID=UPI002350C883|nr:glycosyltransferase [Altibacter sp. HG106]MDC7994002.1 glycosyltransferase [Altibacter sp. HG106]